MCHIGTKAALLRDLKESGQVLIKHIPGSENTDLFTKNLDGQLFKKFCRVYNGGNEYLVVNVKS